MATVVHPEPSFEEAASLRRFWDDNYQRLLCDYPEQFVAVREGEVVASDADLVTLYYKLKELHLDPRTDVAIQLITTEAHSLLL